MNWLVTTTHSKDYDGVAAITDPNNIEYCRRWGYEYNVHHAGFDGVHTYQNAYMLFMRQMLPYYDAILMIATDVLILRHDISLESIFDPAADQQLASENNWECGSSVNNDIMFWRCTPSSFELIHKILEDRPIYSKVDWNWQRQLIDLIKEKNPLVNKLKVVPAQVMNSYPEPGLASSYQEGNFAVHPYMNLPNIKVEILKKFVSKIKK